MVLANVAIRDSELPEPSSLGTIRSSSYFFLLGTLLVSFGVCPGIAAAQSNNPFLDLFGYSQQKQRTERPARAKEEEQQEELEVPKAPLLSSSTIIALETAIQKYQQIVLDGGWRPIRKGRSLKEGDIDDRVVALKRRLLKTGDLRDPRGQRDLYNASLVRAVQRFQRRYGLTPSGKMNRRTFRALNVPAIVRLEQLRLNRRRIRDLIEQVAEQQRYVLINIPAYQMQAVAGNQLELVSRVVVGKPSTPTPNVTAQIRAINFYPHWNVPKSIAARALIPEIKKDPEFLYRERIRVFETWGGEEIDPRGINWWGPEAEKYVFRQEPGSFNALGVVRIDMPNKHIVYMHDTPLKKLFNYHLRPYSAGCVRVQKALDLATWLLSFDDPEWNRARVDSMVISQLQETIDLKTKTPVHFVYVTAWATEFGEVAFREDIYNRDGSRALVASAGNWEKTSEVAP